MTDQHQSYRKAGKMFASHDWVNHGKKEFVRGEVHNNTAESFNANLEREKLGVFNYMSKRHLVRYLHEICFRWNHRIPELKEGKEGGGAEDYNETNASDGKTELTIDK